MDKVLSSHEQEIIPTTSLGANNIEIEFQTDCNVYVDLRQTYLVLKIKLVKGRSSDTYKTTEKRKEHKEDTVFTEAGDDDVEFIEEDEVSASEYSSEQFSPFHFFLMQIFTLATTKSTIRTDFLLTNLTFLTISKVH